jgi:hypothetical protein
MKLGNITRKFSCAAVFIVSLLINSQSGFAQNAPAQALPCDVTSGGYLSFSEFQVILNNTQDVNSDGTIKICLPSWAMIYKGAADFRGLTVERDNITISAPNGEYSIIYNINASGFGDILTVSRAKNFSLENIYFINYAQYGSILNVYDGAQVKEIKGSIFYTLGSGASAISAMGDVAKTVAIGTIKNSQFYQFTNTGDQNSHAIGIKSSYLDLDTIKDSLFYNMGKYDTAMYLNYSMVSEVNNLTINTKGNGIETAESTVHLIHNSTISAVRSALYFTGSTKGTRVGSIENMNFVLDGESGSGIYLTGLSMIDNVRNFFVKTNNYQAQGMRLWGSVKIGSIDSFVSDGPGLGFFIWSEASIREISRFSIRVKAGGPGAQHGIYIWSGAKIDLLHNGVIETPAGVKGIDAHESAIIGEKINVREINL